MGCTEKLTQPTSQYIQDIIILETKNLNAHVKRKLLDDYQDEIRAETNKNSKYNRLNAKDSQFRSREMQNQTVNCLSQTINKLAATP